MYCIVYMDYFSWFVGIVEGEGCFSYNYSKNTPEFVISMCDEDIIKGIAEYLNVSYRTFVPSGKNVKGGTYKTQHRIHICGRKAFAIAEYLEPYLYGRRKKQIQHIRENYTYKTIHKEGYTPKPKKDLNLPF